MIKFKVRDNPTDPSKYIVELTESPFKGTQFTFGEVKFNEDTENCTMTFDYDLLTPVESNIKEFENHIGQLLIQMIEEQVDKGEVVYKGGTGGTFE